MRAGCRKQEGGSPQQGRHLRYVERSSPGHKRSMAPYFGIDTFVAKGMMLIH